jgi:hypothetical protein
MNVGRHVLDVRHPRHLAVLVAKDLLRIVAVSVRALGKAYVEREGGQELVAMARQLRGNPSGRPQSLRKIAAHLAERGYVTPSGRSYSASAIASMLRDK